MGAFIEIDGRRLRYEILGSGPPLVITPGMRNAMDSARPMAEQLSAHYRVIIYDRRNTGGSDMGFDPSCGEGELWARDLYELLGALDARPAYVLGISLGAGVSLAMAMRHPTAVRALILGWVAGGDFPRDRLAHALHGEFIAAAQAGGMAAVAETSFFKERIEQNRRVRDQLLRCSISEFVTCMQAWERAFRAPAPIVPISEEALRGGAPSIPTLVIAGDDEIHLESASRRVHELMPGSEFHPPMLTRAEWESLGAPAPKNHPSRHNAIAAWRGLHCPPVIHEYLQRCGR